MDKIIIYVAGGFLGDFIHQLSVINEKYIETGKKGLLYIKNFEWKFDINKTFNDLKTLVNNQEYIYDFKIYNNEQYDIDLSIWRHSYLLYNANWKTIFSNVYNISWASKRWLKVDINPFFVDKIIISHSLQRWNNVLNYKSFFNKFDKNKLIFVSSTIDEYENFKNNTGIIIPFYHCKTLEEMAVCINSCELFIGNLSSPLAFAYSLHKSCIGIRNDNGIGGDNIHIHSLDNEYEFIKMYV